MSDTAEIFNASYARTLGADGNRDRFLGTFYDRFIASSPDIREKFAHTNINKQREMLNEAVYFVISFFEDDKVSTYMKDIARKHNQSSLNISSSMYASFLQCMLETLMEFDPSYDENVENAWREVIGKTVDFMLSYNDLPSP